ncbi:MAG: CHAT domain-containing protein [Cyanobacteria bacterium P01_E01_bin.42]
MERELDAIAEYRKTKIFLNEQFTFENFSNNHGRDRITHIATHTTLKGKELVLQFFDRQISLDLLRQSSLDPVDLLILSACLTGFDTDSEYGFAGLSLAIDAKSVIATLWQVGDEGSANLASAFHKYLSSSATPEEALQLAQKDMIRQGAHPAFWGGFTLIGSPW